MGKLTKAVTFAVLGLWALAGMHCRLELLPGFDFLKSCCFVDAARSSAKDCEKDGCGTIERGNYRAEEQTASSPQPLLILALRSVVTEAPQPALLSRPSIRSRPPDELPKGWQFSHRTALPPRAPSIAS